MSSSTSSNYLLSPSLVPLPPPTPFSPSQFLLSPLSYLSSTAPLASPRFWQPKPAASPAYVSSTQEASFRTITPQSNAPMPTPTPNINTLSPLPNPALLYHKPTTTPTFRRLSSLWAKKTLSGLTASSTASTSNKSVSTPAAPVSSPISKFLGSTASSAYNLIVSPRRLKMSDNDASGGGSRKTQPNNDTNPLRNKLTILTVVGAAARKDRIAPTPGAAIQANADLPWFLKLTSGQQLRIFQDEIEDSWQYRIKNDANFSQYWDETGNTRNRYANVRPFENNRLKLEVPEGQSSYINASPIKLPLSSGLAKRYIATQGPKPNTVTHFWRMIKDSSAKIPVIIMLTVVKEAGHEKCFQYYPSNEGDIVSANDSQDPTFVYNIRVKSKNYNEKSRSEHREIEIVDSNGKVVKEAHHFLFEGWDDFKVLRGEKLNALLELITLSNRLSENDVGEEQEKIVHCSAGVGRTGTYIGIDWLLAELNYGRCDNVPAPLPATAVARHEGNTMDLVWYVVDEMRRQRPFMVIMDSQFSLLYNVLTEKWLALKQKSKNAQANDVKPVDNEDKKTNDDDDIDERVVDPEALYKLKTQA